MNTENHPWQSSRVKFDSQILPKLKTIGQKIGNEARNGNPEAQRVVQLYSLLYKSFDPLTLIQLEEALSEYELLKT